jgi:hypothetical protein
MGKSNRWNETELKILMDNKHLDPKELVSLIPSKTRSGISHKKSRMNITKTKFWSAEEIELLKHLYPTGNKDDLIKIFGRNWDSIKYKANLNNIHQTKPYRVSNLLEESISNYYWVGFLLADGWFTKQGERFGMGIEISTKDEEHLKSLISVLGKIPIHYRKRNDNCSIAIIDNDIKKIMDKFDIKPRKTINPPDMSRYSFDKEKLFALIIGFIDGDGMIRTIKNQSSQITIEISDIWYKNLEFIENFVFDYFDEQRGYPLTHLKNVKNNSRNTTAILTFSRKYLNRKIKEEAIKLNIPFLKRKWDKIILH